MWLSNSALAKHPDSQLFVSAGQMPFLREQNIDPISAHRISQRPDCGDSHLDNGFKLGCSESGYFYLFAGCYDND